ncbi:hypothetical protein PM082_018251 [Marasmius tenuissimus]|nr:hypothetical protein PM082_018251 [Marasmius tenuissimus]
MSGSLGNVPEFPSEYRLKNASNYPRWRDLVVSKCRGKGLEGYLNGTIPLPTTPSQLLATSTPVNSSTPTLEEWQYREGHVSSIIYQNVENPSAHGLKPTMGAVVMSSKLKAKFERTSKMMQMAARKKLEAEKLEDGGNLEDHLDTLTALRQNADDVGCEVSDEDMISITLNSLPDSHALLMQNLMGKNDLDEVQHLIREYWGYSTKSQPKSSSNDPSAFAAPICEHCGNRRKNNRPRNQIICDNCDVPGHTRANCWAAGGGKEGKAPSWWEAPKGKEPKGYTAPSSTSKATPSTPTAAAVVNPTPIKAYCLGDFTTSDLDCEGQILEW